MEQNVSEKILVSGIRENQKVDSLFLVKSKTIATGKTGKPYIFLRLSDKSGEIKGYIWDNVEKYSGGFKAGDIIKIKSRSSAFQNEIQLGITEAERIDKGSLSENILSFFLKSTKYDTNKMFGELLKIIDVNVKNEYILSLIKKFTDDPSFVKKLRTMPAAKSIHHSYVGGLLEHTLSMLKIAVFLADNYAPYVNKDILIAGALLHDAGKMEELSNKNDATEYSDEGRLIGHIVLGAAAVDRKISEIKGFPEELRLLILHLIISHHGELEFGSPKRPKTIEALLLHFIDNMDAKANIFMDVYESQQTPWSQYYKQLDRYILNPALFSLKDRDEKEDGKDDNRQEVYSGELF